MKNGLIIVTAAALLGGVAGYLAHDTGPGQSDRAGGPAGGMGAGSPAGARAAPLVVAKPARFGEISETVEAIGTAQANESLTLTAKVTDTVRRVNFEDGEFVEAGAVLIELTNEEEEALLEEARANLEDAENQLRRFEDLAARGLTSESELDVATSRAAASAARLDTVLARLQDRLILAPFDGLLGFRGVSPGTLVTPSTPITTVDDTSTIKLDFTVPETFLSVMSPGARVMAQSASWGERTFAGVVRTVGSRVDPVTRAVVVRAHIPNEDRALRPGMLLTVRVITAERRALVVDEGAVFQVGAQAYVYRVGEDGLAHQREVELGARRFGIAEITAGLQEGDLIVTEGIVKLRDGARVRLQVTEPEVSARPQDSTQPRPAG